MFNKLLPLLMVNIAWVFASLPSMKLIRNLDLKGRLFHNSMFDFTSHGRVHCAMRCNEVICCRTLTFNPATNRCTGYRRKVKPEETFISNPEIEVYQWNEHTCILLRTDAQNKYGAAYQCSLDNGNLIRIDSWAKLSAAQIVLRGSNSYLVWVDGEDSAGTDTYIMSNGQVLTLNPAFWNPGEPSANDEPCVAIQWGSKLNDVHCGQIARYLCEY